MSQHDEGARVAATIRGVSKPPTLEERLIAIGNAVSKLEIDLDRLRIGHGRRFDELQAGLRDLASHLAIMAGVLDAVVEHAANTRLVVGRIPEDMAEIKAQQRIFNGEPPEGRGRPPGYKNPIPRPFIGGDPARGPDMSALVGWLPQPAPDDMAEAKRRLNALLEAQIKERAVRLPEDVRKGEACGEFRLSDEYKRRWDTVALGEDGKVRDARQHTKTCWAYQINVDTGYALGPCNCGADPRVAMTWANGFVPVVLPPVVGSRPQTGDSYKGPWTDAHCDNELLRAMTWCPMCTIPVVLPRPDCTDILLGLRDNPRRPLAETVGGMMLPPQGWADGAKRKP